MAAEPLTLVTICGGAAFEVFQRELQEVLDNIADVNTEATKTRKVSLVFEIKPSKTRRTGDVTFTCNSKLAAVEPVQSTIFIGTDAGKTVAFTEDVRQEQLFPNPAIPSEPASNVVGMSRNQAASGRSQGEAK